MKKTKAKGLLRNPTINPPSVRAFLKLHGNEVVKSVELFKTPLEMKSIADKLTGKSVSTALNKLGIDEVYHLYMVINGKYQLEKLHVISLKAGVSPKKPNTLNEVVPISNSKTMNEMLENTQKRMGVKYGSYNLRDNNCGDFLSAVLSSNGWSNPSAQKFVTQRAQDILNNLPSFYEKLVNAFTTAQAIGNKLVEGEGKLLKKVSSKDKLKLKSLKIKRISR